MSILKVVLGFIGRALLRAAMDSQLKQVIYNAVEKASYDHAAPGAKKMDAVLNEVKSSGIKALLDETESTLRTKIEQAKIDLKIYTSLIGEILS